MQQRNLLARIENAEKIADAALGQTFSGGCICFPKNEPPFFGQLSEEEIATKVKCHTPKPAVSESMERKFPA